MRLLQICVHIYVCVYVCVCAYKGKNSTFVVMSTKIWLVLLVFWLILHQNRVFLLFLFYFAYFFLFSFGRIRKTCYLCIAFENKRKCSGL